MGLLRRSGTFRKSGQDALWHVLGRVDNLLVCMEYDGEAESENYKALDAIAQEIYQILQGAYV